MADTTKNELSRALKHQMVTKTLENITVRDITDECHLNRQTFYYHFHDIYELLEWTIEKEAARLVSGSRCRDIRAVLIRLFDFAVTNENFIIHAYKSADRYFVKKFLEDGLRPVIAGIVDEKAENRKISEENRKFITDVFVFILLSVTMEWLDNDMNDNLVRKLDKIIILLDGNIGEAIDRFSRKN